LHGALTGQVRLRPLADRQEELLSAREREVLVLLAEGRTNREIAASLSVTLATVKSHLVRIYAKLEASNRNECLGRAVSLGLLG
jgi:ATP/maltotriose-dependent transcriptional regulator MalT